MKPFLKWVGGKTQILETLFEFFPKECINYHEPFLGGGSVLLELLEKIQKGALRVHGTIYASDANRCLVYTYMNLQKHSTELIRSLQELHNQYSICPDGVEGRANKNPETLQDALTCKESYYYWMRKQYNELRNKNEWADSCKVSAMFIFLNKTCFRGLYREGPVGFNVPYGNYDSNSFFDEDHLRKISTLIQDVHFRVATFEEAWKDMRPGDFVYIDPPYAPEVASSFVGYTIAGFDETMHRTLFDHVHLLRKEGIHFLMSNADVSMVQDAFPAIHYRKSTVVCRRAIHSKDPAKVTTEILLQARNENP